MSEKHVTFIPLADLTEKPKRITPNWVTGSISSPIGNIDKISTEWNQSDTRGEIKARISNVFRMKYRVDPGLYAIGHPDQESPVLLSANYKLSFDVLRRDCKGLDVWVLVLDTKGINVWCAAGKGTFGTQEIIRSVKKEKLDLLVSHRRIISPQLGAPGIEAHVIKKSINFKVKYGPVSTKDIKPYIENGFASTPKMRSIQFGIMDRMVLIPMELSFALKHFWKAILVVLLVFGLTPEGIMFQKVLVEGIPVILLLFFAVIAGAFITPVLLPWIPFRAFSAKGFLTGLLPIFTVHMYSISHPTIFSQQYLLAATYIVMPSLSAFLAFNFTGCTTFTSPSGVTKELKVLIKITGILIPATLILLTIYKLKNWGLI